MAVTLSPEWGPYEGGTDALQFLSRFVDKACSPASGIVWSANGNLYALRAPRRDGDGIGDVVAFQWNKPPPPRAPRQGFWSKVKGFIKDCLEAEGRAEIAKSEADMAMADAMTQVLSRMVHSHQDDGLGVAMDIIGVAISIALIPTGVGVLAGIALLGSAFLLGTDTYAYALELGNDDAGAEEFKKNTERYRIVATIMTLPDLAYGGYKAARELMEVRELRAMDRATANSAAGMASRTQNAARAERLHQIAEKANLRAQIRTEQIHAALKLDGGGRAAGAVGVGLMVREEVQNDESKLHEFMRFLQVHCTAVHGK